LKSAEIVVPIVLDLIKPKSVVDVGCGRGEWLYVFQRQGISDILGIDGEWVDKNKLLIPKESFLTSTLEHPLRINRTFDLVVSLEIAEHLPEKSAEMFIETLTTLGPVILFPAAIPLQGGGSTM